MLPALMTPLEEYFFLADEPEHPMHVIVRMRFVGRLDRVAFQEAVAAVVARHPLLTARVDCDQSPGPLWIASPDTTPDVHWDLPVPPGELPAMDPIDIQQEPGLRLWSVARDEGDEIILQSHHCVSDAIGLCQFTEEVLACYAHRLEGKSGAPRLSDIEWGKFSRRHTPGTNTWRFASKLHRYPARISKGLEIIRRPIAKLRAAQSLRVTGDSTRRLFRCFQYGELETNRIIATSKSLGVTLNSLLMREMFRAAFDEFAESNRWNDDCYIRLSLPINLRRSERDRFTICNSIGCHMVDCLPSRLSNASDLLHWIDRDVAHTISGDGRYMLAAALFVQQWFASGTNGRFGVNPLTKKQQATCLFSNLGVLFPGNNLPHRNGRIVAGDVELAGWDLLPPVMHGVNLAVGIYTYAGRLSLLMHFNDCRLPANRVENLLFRYVDRINTSCGLTSRQSHVA